MVFRYSCLTLKIIAVLALAFVTQSNLSGAQFAPGTGPADQLQLPPPFATPSARNTSKVIGWPAGRKGSQAIYVIGDQITGNWICPKTKA